MAAYASLVSLMQIFHQIEHHPSPPIAMDKKQVESLTEIVMYLQEFLEGYKSPFADGDEADPLEMRIVDAVYAAEDVIESHIADQILPTALASYWHERQVKAIEQMDLIEKDVMMIKDILQSQVSASADSLTIANLYERVMKLTGHMDWIKKEVLDIIEESAGFSTSADLNESLAKKVIEDMGLIKKEVMLLKFIAKLRRRRVSPFAGSSTFSFLYDFMIQVIRDVKKEVLEIVALEDQLQMQVSAAGSSTSANLYHSLGKVIEDMDLIKKEVMLLDMAAVEDQLHKLVSADAGGCSTSSKMLINNSSKSSISRLNSTAMEGFDDVMLRLMEKLVYGECDRQVIPIIGMGGIGKTTLARNIYAHPTISRHFDIHAWVSISQQYNTKELLDEILSQANKQELSSKDETGVALHKCLSYRRYLIVLDDMWSIKTWEGIQSYFPDCSNGSRILVTTRLSNLGSQLDSNNGLEMKFMDDESSWNIFSKIVFGGNSCPLELEKIGKKIVKSCKGLPLSVVVMGGILVKLEPTKECWKSISRSVNSLVNLENDKHCLKILKLSYNHLPVYLKSCFLYMGMYEEDTEIRVSTVIKLWVSEGFLKPVKGKSLETIGKEYLDELIDRNLILVHKFGKRGNIKYCKIHDLLRDLCLREAEKERFYHVVRQHSPQGTWSQRRVVIPENTSKEEVLHAIGTTSHVVRSYISERVRFRVLPDLRLLRILQARSKNIYRPQDYSLSLRKLSAIVNLRLLDVHSSLYTQLTSSVNFLWSLQTLIVDLEGNINYASVEIWNMPQLRHVRFRSGAFHLPDPPSECIVIMEILQTLKGVTNFKCDEMMVYRIPNIKKLDIFYDRDDDYCVHNLERLQKLESLKCFACTGTEFCRKLTFPHSLKSLTLSMFGARGLEDVLEKASTLPLLQKLKLIGGYFTTGEWETVEGQFLSLKYLSLHWCLGLERWMMESSHFPCLEHLYVEFMDLEIPVELGEIPTLKSVYLYKCNESAVKSAKRMVEEQEELQGEELISFQVEVKLNEENEQLQSLANSNFRIM